MQRIEPAVDEAAARQRLRPGRFSRLMGSLLYRWDQFVRRQTKRAGTDVTPQATPDLPRLELIWMPAYRMTVAARVKGNDRTATVLVGGRDGTVRVVDGRTLELQPHDGDVFPATVNASRATEAAQTGLTNVVRSTPGMGVRPDVGDTSGIAPVAYPYWVETYERRPGRLDIRVLDAVTGQPAGPRVKIAIVEAFVEQHRASHRAAGSGDSRPIG